MARQADRQTDRTAVRISTLSIHRAGKVAEMVVAHVAAWRTENRKANEFQAVVIPLAVASHGRGDSGDRMVQMPRRNRATLRGRSLKRFVQPKTYLALRHRLTKASPAALMPQAKSDAGSGTAAGARNPLISPPPAKLE